MRFESNISGDSVIGSTGANAPNLFKTREQYRYVGFEMSGRQLIVLIAGVSLLPLDRLAIGRL